ncbi:hypothetical protein BKA65DRAFT_481372 [Rhexocercosporidium sp. MPI-PUGE-AT-0058]|nr:hypothetical protein BKA65DRAFT_481372 [Rhexocercosporidium sp. MPI-PUGE-AT-0058]
MLSMLASVKALVLKDDQRNHRSARIKRTTVTAIECISADMFASLKTAYRDQVDRLKRGGVNTIDISRVEARVKRAEKDAAKKAKGKGERSRKRRTKADTAILVKTKRGRKRKSDLPDGHAPEPSIKVPRISEALLPETAPR